MRPSTEIRMDGSFWILLLAIAVLNSASLKAISAEMPATSTSLLEHALNTSDDNVVNTENQMLLFLILCNLLLFINPPFVQINV